MESRSAARVLPRIPVRLGMGRTSRSRSTPSRGARGFCRVAARAAPWGCGGASRARRGSLKRAAHPLRANSSIAWLRPAGWAPLRDGQGRVAPSLAGQIERHYVAPPVEPPRADQAGGIVKELHPRHIEIHDGVPNRLTAGRVQIHAIVLAERIHATPSNPSLAEIVVVHTARTPVHYRMADMSAVGGRSMRLTASAGLKAPIRPMSVSMQVAHAVRSIQRRSICLEAGEAVTPLVRELVPPGIETQSVKHRLSGGMPRWGCPLPPSSSVAIQSPVRPLQE